LTKAAEKEQWPEKVVLFFTFGERRQITLFPSLLFDFGLKPSVGFKPRLEVFFGRAEQPARCTSGSGPRLAGYAR
jgi:hypothetical protein